MNSFRHIRKEIVVVLMGLLLMMFTACWQKGPSEVDFTSFSQPLLGLWKMEGKALYEQWMRHENGSVTARVFKIEGSDTLVLEQVELLQQEHKYLYRVRVQGQNQGAAIDFIQQATADNQWVFINHNHDFPQQISYRPIGDNLLEATISGIVNGEYQQRHFKYQRVNF